MTDRKTPYQFGKRIGPDIAAVVAKYPQHCLVHYRGCWYKFMTCAWAECPHKKGYWRRYGGSHAKGLGSSNPNQTYCSEVCAMQSARHLRRLRQARYVRRRKMRITHDPGKTVRRRS